MSTIEKAVGRFRRHGIEETGNSSIRRAPPGMSLLEDAVVAEERAGLHVDLLRLEAAGIITDPLKDWVAVEEIRVIKRPLLRQAFGKERHRVDAGNLILITSCLPAEGKTFMTMSLALGMVAEKDVTVLLVDADVVKPSLSRILGLEGRLGLVDLLRDPDMQVADVLLRTDLQGLTVIPAGSADPHSTELLSSGRMFSLVSELSERYTDRVVLFDTTPLLASTHAGVMSQLVGQTLLVVESLKTSKPSLEEGLARMDRTKNISVVLNKAPRRKKIHYYGAYYGGPGQQQGRTGDELAREVR